MSIGTPVDSMPMASVQLPRYKCHKEVWADSITEIHADYMILSSCARIDLVNSCGYTDLGNRMRVSESIPIIGDYFVIYDNDYQSWSPKDVFESGYSRLEV